MDSGERVMSAMKVEIKPFHIPKQTDFGEVQQRVGLDRVYVNGKLGGYMPWEKNDPFCGVFHPLSGFPPELVADVVDASSVITGTLSAPVASEDESDEDNEE